MNSGHWNEQSDYVLNVFVVAFLLSGKNSCDHNSHNSASRRKKSIEAVILVFRVPQSQQWNIIINKQLFNKIYQYLRPSLALRNHFIVVLTTFQHFFKFNFVLYSICLLFASSIDNNKHLFIPEPRIKFYIMNGTTNKSWQCHIPWIE